MDHLDRGPDDLAVHLVELDDTACRIAWCRTA